MKSAAALRPFFSVPSSPETWAPCPDFPAYEVSSQGRIRNAARGNLLRPSPNDRGYLCVNVLRDKKLHRIKVHRQVAKAFCPNPENLPEVNHEDGVKANCLPSNLVWCTRSYNLLHKWRVLGQKHGAYALKRMKEANSGHNNHSARHLFYQGQPHTCASLAALCGRSKAGVAAMIAEGLTPEQIVAAPRGKHRHPRPRKPTL